jgi:two-component system, response regulator / RNA-binding antiterminator
MKILVAECDNSHAKELFAQFKALDGSFAVTFAGPGENLLEAVRQAQPDVVIVDMARPDRDGLDSVRALNAQALLPVLMFIDEDDPHFMEEAIDAGVCSYHAGGVALPAIKPILRTALAVFQRMRGLQTQLADAQEQIEARQVVDAAKRLLMTQDKMSEPAAHRFLQRRAMDQQKKLTEIAAELLRSRAAGDKNG